MQWLIDKILSPTPPDPRVRLGRPKIAVVGAGITGVTSAVHCVGHGFDVVIFGAGPEENVGGIWSKGGYPDRQQIISQVRQLWERYGLDTLTKFNTKVNRVYQDDRGRWIINSLSNGRFDGIISAIGTCGVPKVPEMPGMNRFKGEIMIVIGGGASAVEALEFASAEGAQKIYISARSDKWITPRNPFWNMLLAMNIFGQETDLAPSNKGIFTDTPMVNFDVMDKLQTGKAEWVRCDIEQFTEDGVLVNKRAKCVAPGEPGQKVVIKGDLVVMATGCKRPQLSFLPDSCFEEPYVSPNCTVGNWHIGIYPRFLLMFLVDPLTRPSPFWMKRWIDMTRFLNLGPLLAPSTSLPIWSSSGGFVFCVWFNPFRWKWALFVFFGLGFMLPRDVVEVEDRIRNELGVNGDEADGRDLGIGF
ncbi:hypothetical protein B0H67DRAFT_600946 [Lasiosphaeris hirsuta]|uniref:FAD/NAD(P)-binding domain-containing protein n=1 Tax=Lasiosphaeris hirsuta TaxID=260670 RepID=A0AA40AG90_9PEZI|nr:hypothetical protein B0H67DRAFT_600946 [Lasiosphaeris hirsuta]